MEAINTDACFSLREIEPSLYLIREKFYVSENVCNIWLLQGETLDVVIDTGIGLWDLPGFLKSKNLIGDKRVLAVASHIHFDHTGGMHQFKEQAIHTLEYEDLAKGDNVAMVSYMLKSDISKKPCESFCHKNYKVKAVTATRVLEEGDIIDLGDKKLQVLHLPGHSKGSIALFESVKGYLFAGDVLYNDILYDFLPGSCVEDYIDSFRRLQEMSSRISKIFPGHHEILDRKQLLDISNDYIQNATSCSSCLRSCKKCFLLVYCKGKHTNNVPAKCMYYGCCCCCIQLSV